MDDDAEGVEILARKSSPALGTAEVLVSRNGKKKTFDVVLDALEAAGTGLVPTDRFYGVASKTFPLPFVVYRKIPGVPLDTLGLPADTTPAIDIEARRQRITGR